MLLLGGDRIERKVDANRDTRNFTGPIIQIRVGPEKMTYSVHRDLVMSKSPYFKEIFNPSTAQDESQDQDKELVLDLDNDDPELIDMFVQYTYWPSIVLAPESDVVDLEVRLSVLSQLYILSERFGVPHLQSKAIVEAFELLSAETDDNIIFKDNEGFLDDLEIRLETIGEIYTKTASDEDSFRKLLATNMARHWDCYNRRGMAACDDGSESELSKFIEATPRFTKDLLWYLHNSEMVEFAPHVRMRLSKRRHLNC